MSNFAIETYTTKTNKVDLVDAAHINAVQTSVVSIESALNILVSQNGSLAQGSSFPTVPAPVEGQMFYRNDIAQLYIYTGSSWQDVASQSWVPNNIQVFTSSGTWTLPAGVQKVYVKVIGGGGNGGRGDSGSGAGGNGGGGGYAEGVIAVTGNVSVTIGSTNSFAGTTTISATIGSNGADGSGSTTGAHGAGGSGSGGTINLPGANGGGGGTSVMSTGAAIALPVNAGSPGNSYGGGGTGGAAGAGGGTAGGAGDPGAVIVYY